MKKATSPHLFHIPVMGVGHSVDTPLRVAPLGIDSVVSLVDDHLLEKLREYYAGINNLPYQKIDRTDEDSRAKRITAYLDLIQHLIQLKMEVVKNQPFSAGTDKTLYFDLLPEESDLKKDYLKFVDMPSSPEKSNLEESLTARMTAGALDVNIMVKLDRMLYDAQGLPKAEELSDAKSALRGFANSTLASSIVFSAGLNPKLFSYLVRFREFYRDAYGEIRKKIILKVSDYRSALIQSKYLAKRGLEVSEYRVESGLNCGGHAFPARGQLLPWILKEFREKWHELTEGMKPYVHAYYGKMGWSYVAPADSTGPLLTVQGGIGTPGEAERLRSEFGVARTGWGSPFLLVPEVTNVDDATRDLLCRAKEEDLYLSDISPLGIPFNMVKGTKSEIWTRRRVEEGRAGSPCPKGFAVTNMEFSDRPICTASYEYQKKKLDAIDQLDLSENEREQEKAKVFEKACICDHLGNGILIKLGIEQEEKAPQIVCPGPNIAWFDRVYSLREMVDHIYGRIASLVPSNRPHMFAKEIEMNVDFFLKLAKKKAEDSEELKEMRENLEKGMAYCLDLAKKIPHLDENLASLSLVVETQRARLNSVCLPA